MSSTNKVSRNMEDELAKVRAEFSNKSWRNFGDSGRNTSCDMASAFVCMRFGNGYDVD